MTRPVIFDFDGVLADSFDCLYNLNAFALQSVGLSLTERDYRGMFNRNFHEGLRLLIGDEEKWQKCRRIKERNFSEYYSRVKLFPFSSLLIRKQAEQSSLAIVSSTQSKFVKRVLGEDHLDQYFKGILGSSALSKAGELREAIALMKTNSETAIFVTDSVGDIEVGQKLGIETVAVSWGFHPGKDLWKMKPSDVFDDPRKLQRYLNRRSDRRCGR